MRRPKRSASSPKIKAPTGRSASVAVVVKTMAFLETPKWCESVSKRNTITKKSKASSVQPRNPASKAWCLPFVGKEAFISGNFPFLRLRHQAIQCHTACRGHQPQKQTRPHPPETQLANAE